MEDEEGKLVIPGERLAHEEEFMPGFGTYSEDGEVYSSNIGIAESVKEKREVRVKVRTEVPMFYKRGMFVYGQVAQVGDNFVIVDVFPMDSGGFRYIPRQATHMIPVSEIKRGFVKSARDEFKVGDIVKARILAIDQYTVTLTTKSADLGVVKAFCTQCRHPLVLVKGTLKCSNCGNVERRKLSIEYGKVGGIFYGVGSDRGKGQ